MTGILDFMQQNPQGMLGLAQGLMSPQRDKWGRAIPGSGFARGMGGFQQGYNADQRKQALLGAGAELGMSSNMAQIPGMIPAAYAAKHRAPPALPSSIREFQFAQSNPDYSDFLNRNKASDAKFGKTPGWGVDAEGNYVPLQYSDTGQATPSTLPDGIRAVPPGDIAQQRAFGTEYGKTTGKKEAGRPEAIAKAEQMLATIRDVKTDPNRQAATGRSSMFNFMPGTGQRDYAAKVDQLRGQTFLQAYESLKGGGVITEIEGQKAENAIARLDVAQTEQGFLKSVTELERVVQAGLMRLKSGRKAPGANTTTMAPSAAPQQADSNQTAPSGIDPTDWGHMTPEERALWQN